MVRTKSTMIRPSIAVVDDDKSARESTTGLLRSLGIIAKTFASGSEFLQSNRVRITSCLIASAEMPDMSGLELYGRMVAFGSPIPTILTAACADESVQTRALNAGIIAYLINPSVKRRCWRASMQLESRGLLFCRSRGRGEGGRCAVTAA